MARPIASCAALALAAAAVAGLAGWAMLLVLAAMAVCGLIILANEAAKPIIRSMHDGEAIRPAGGADGEG